MILELSYLSAVVFLSWIATASLDGLAVVVLAALVLFSSSVPINLLLLLTITLVSFIVSARCGRPEHTGIAQKYYALRIFGVVTALLGSIVYPPLMMFGLLVSLPLFLWTILFQRHFESMKTEDYLYSTVLPALATLVVLSRVKPVVQADYSQLWDISLTVLGLASLALGSVLAFFNQQTKQMIIFLTQSIIGLCVFLLVIDAGKLGESALSAWLCFALTGPLLILAAKRVGRKAEMFGRVLSLGMPGFLSYSALYYSFKTIATMNVSWVWLVLSAMLLQALAIMGNAYDSDETGALNTKSGFRMILIVVVQLLCALGIFWVDRGGVL